MIAQRILSFIAALILLVAAIFTAETAFNTILDFRKLERIPLTSILGSTGGEVLLRGAVTPFSKAINSPDTNTAVVYYRYKIEEEQRDSDGDTSWHTIKDVSQSTDFFLQDNSDKIRVRAQNSRQIQWKAKRKFQTKRGKRRHTEWRIDVNDYVTLFGWMDRNIEDAEINFSTEGDYLPIISSESSGQERSKLGWKAILFLAASITATTFMVYCLIFSLRIHKTLVFLGFVSLCCSLLLLHYGWKSVQLDVTNGYERYKNQLERSDLLIHELLHKKDLSLEDRSAFNLDEVYFSTLNEKEKAQINGWRMVSYLVRERFLSQISHHPEKWYAHGRQLDELPEIVLPQDQLIRAQKQLDSFELTRTNNGHWWNLLALIVTLGMSWLAFRFIKVKRMQENLPSCNTAGATFGLIELIGELQEESKPKLLKGPLSGEACCWYHYTVMEHRSSGKKSQWVTIEDRIEKQPFFCKDQHGQLRVFPGKAEIISKNKSSQRRGNRQYIEIRLCPGDKLYILGKATIDKTKGDKLVLKHEKDSTYIISNRSEDEVKFMKAASGMAALSAAVCAMFLALLVLAGSKGSFSSLDFLLSSMATPVFFIAVTAILMFNDLVFLKKRCERAWANIQVSLKKRSNLIPRLERLLKALLKHEKELHRSLSALREKQTSAGNSLEVDKYMSKEHVFIHQLRVTVEKYPELKTNEMMQNMHRRIVKLENEIAMIRAGFNNSVEIYNTRIQQFPDILIAKPFRFSTFDLLQFEKEAHKIPEVSI